MIIGIGKKYFLQARLHRPLWRRQYLVRLVRDIDPVSSVRAGDIPGYRLVAGPLIDEIRIEFDFQLIAQLAHLQIRVQQKILITNESRFYTQLGILAVSEKELVGA
jgi:hypothetical protein